MRVGTFEHQFEPAIANRLTLIKLAPKSGPYACTLWCKEISRQVASGLALLHSEIIPPKDSTFIMKVLMPHPSTSPEQVAFIVDPSIMANVLNTLPASGGGDSPEASTDALQLCLMADWNEGASRVTILITNAPPHGVEETRDGFSDGCPLCK